MFLAARRQAERDALQRRAAGTPAPGGPAGEPWFLPGPAAVPAQPAEGVPNPVEGAGTRWPARGDARVPAQPVQGGAALDGSNAVPGLPPSVVPLEASAEPRFFAPNLGITYVRVPNSDGTFGARLVRPPALNSPAAALGLEPGDVVFELDGLRFRTHQDVLNHTGDSTTRFIDVRTSESPSATLILP
jgi:hypothetical protein